MLLLPLPLLLLPAPGAPLPVQDGPAGRLLVLDKAAATAEILALPGGEVLARLSTGPGPHEVAVSPDGSRAVVSNYGGREPGRSLTVLDLRRLRVAGELDLGEAVRPHGLAFEEDGAALWVTAEAAGELWRLSFPEGRVLARARTGARVSHMLALGPRHAWVASIGSGSVTPVERASARALPALATGAGAEGLALEADGRRLWVGNREADTVIVLDTASRRILRTLACSGFPIRVTLAEARGLALVSCPRDGDVKAFALADGALRGRIPCGREAAAGAGERLFGERFGKSPTPIGMVLDGSGRWLLVALANADAVAMVDLERLQVQAYLETGPEPDGMAWLPPGP